MTSILQISICVALGTPLSAQSLDYEDHSWTQNPSNGHWYTALPGTLWHQAESTGQWFGGHLATVRSQSENDWILAQYGSTVQGIRAALWIGLTDEVQEGTWEWSSGEPVIFQGWGTGEPNGHTHGPDHDYAYIAAVPWLALQAGDWNDDQSNTGSPDWPLDRAAIIELAFDPTADSDGGGVLDAYEDQNHDGIVDPWETDRNDPLDDDLAMYVRDLAPGERLAVRVRQGRPGAFVTCLASLTGPGPSNVGLGVTVDLSAPISEVAAFQLDARGNALVRGPRVPASATVGRSVWLQGVEIGWHGGGFQARTTNLLAQPIGAN